MFLPAPTTHTKLLFKLQAFQTMMQVFLSGTETQEQTEVVTTTLLLRQELEVTQ